MAYTDITNIEDKLGSSLTQEQSDYFTAVLDDAIDQFIDTETNETFGSDTATDVYVSGAGTDLLTIPTMHSITAVMRLEDDGTDDSAVTDYRTYPGAGNNKYALKKISGEWAEGWENYKISGKLGYATVPQDITHVATELAVSALTTNNNYKSEKVGDWAVTYADVQKLSSLSQSILNKYKRLSRSI